ncbi:hypothetical protein PY092_14995 [Muricauda sp. 334s03]|uniref:DUF3299 domain-containing protein n=1 Tax=Flagellimonas yonaguniensis TaxID=3031325 RepID=A0ABT5Y1Z9_9FLAO|nr:hypothetical protein [[Muricauda] yonaguniensis]MDF0717469.1 hypothetical protein [[Muricauda] yonaguniensis]
MKNNILIAFFFLSSVACFSQTEINWWDLSRIDYTEKFFPAYGENFLYPEFSDYLKSLEGEKVAIMGYFLNIDPSGKIFILSKNPMASCFFCGMGGPETAMELQFKSKPDFTTDDILYVTGTLKLNADDVQHFNYILTDCVAQKMD